MSSGRQADLTGGLSSGRQADLTGELSLSRSAPHVFVEDVRRPRLLIADAQRHHLAKVLRLRDGDEVIATDGRGAFVPARLAGESLEAHGEPLMRRRPEPGIGVIQAIPSGRKLDEVVRVLAELGIQWMQPVTSEHAEPFAKPSARERRLERLRAIAVSALEQSRSGWLMEVRSPSALDDAVVGVDRALVMEPDAALALGDVAVADASEVVVVVGPERGWTDQDRAILAPFPSVRLGSEVLRTEHAAAAAAAGLLARTRWRSAATNPDGDAY